MIPCVWVAAVSLFIKDIHGRHGRLFAGPCTRMSAVAPPGAGAALLGWGRFSFLYTFLPGLYFLSSHITFTVYET